MVALAQDKLDWYKSMDAWASTDSEAARQEWREEQMAGGQWSDYDRNIDEAEGYDDKWLDG